MKVKVARDRTRAEGSYGAWDGTVFDGEQYIGAVTGSTRDECVQKARELVDRFNGTEQTEEWVEL